MNRPKILIVGGGISGLECARRLEHRLAPDEADIAMVAAHNYQLYLPLLPQVASGTLTPQSIAIPLRRCLRRTRVIPGGAIGIDGAAKVCVVRTISRDVINESFDYLLIAAGSVTRQFDIPGLAEHALGAKTLAEAAYLRDHVISQLDLAAATQDEAEQAARLRFVVVGGGYTGTETASCLHRLTADAVHRYPRLNPSLIRWHLIDIAPKLMPELGEKLGQVAMRTLQRRGVEISLGVSVARLGPDHVEFTDGRSFPCHTVIWTAGVAASPLAATLGAESIKGRLTVTPRMQVPRFDGVFAVGDAAAVPDLVKGGDAICPPTAQHAQRQGRTVADNLVAAVRGQQLHPYTHRDLGMVVDLGGRDSVARPLGVNLTGVPAQLVTRGYHLFAMRSGVARFRTAANWFLGAVTGADYVRTGFQAYRPGTLSDFERTDAYLTPEQVKEHVTSAS
ncbi:NAD(P)/FAD-dependent oxidoreductase [Saccharopolyspora rosea]|uniref:NAD(P)/FAD-dependent oxidoreductase n=1 Tax=Saccharopolyspora rosea TaxID=524884 RepID=A0ABW3FRX4_9PSEU|nr:NAD(P)/FAD-dependent oxidoreductase [Saccharopolyspora rosea]